MNNPTINPPAAVAETSAPSGPLVAELIGISLADPVTHLRELVQALRAQLPPQSRQFAELELCARQLHRVSVQSQQLARVMKGRLRQSHERLSLHAIVLDILVQAHGGFKQQGIQVRQHLRPVDVIVDPGLLVALVETLVDWGAQLGRELQVRLEVKNWPAHALLSLRVLDLRTDAHGALPLDNLAWQLVVETARLMNVTVRRELGQDAAQASLEFSRTVRQLSGITALDAERQTGADSSQLQSQSSQLAGLRVLLVSDDVRLQREVKSVCTELDLRLEVALTAAQGFEMSELSQPSMIILDESLRTDFFDDYLQRLMRERLHFHAVEVAATTHTGFEISSWDQTTASRIGRDTVKEQLKTVILLELGR
ncbi:hypothetical protein [Ramlibacter rhizophilus]|uniref:Response regulatory domain-containing protein n=1 Tax=Ramlibacter rhizophilus TaxID=1781167 RepID=A0A4Z0BC53_9BURK|nr:hypothetical protein [Ramlibacter rhizophilus]TFY96211.1 hypothetical protein EZ242_21415 [Ramlibacter rhizophilus]